MNRTFESISLTCFIISVAIYVCASTSFSAKLARRIDDLTRRVAALEATQVVTNNGRADDEKGKEAALSILEALGRQRGDRDLTDCDTGEF